MPVSLEEHFDEPGAATAWTYTSIVRTDGDGTVVSREPGIAVGAQVQLPADGSTYTLYFLFPLDEQAGHACAWSPARCSPPARCCWSSSPGVTWLVTRQVVTPVRMARRVAERLAAGRLQERLRVSGEDDLARLAIVVQPDGHATCSARSASSRS